MHTHIKHSDRKLLLVKIKIPLNLLLVIMRVIANGITKGYGMDVY
jgi:hypothetical protein